MDKRLEDILDICWEKINKGVSIEDCLKDYPELQDELRELLSLAKKIQDVPKPLPSKEKLASCLIRIGEAIASQKKISIFQKFRWIYLPQPVLVRAFALVIILTFVSWGTANLSAHSIPGDILYPLKLITEKVKFLLTATAPGRVELRLIYSQERAQELVKNLKEKGELSVPLLKAMLNEAGLALEDIPRLADDERTFYISRLKHLNAYHKDVLESLKPEVPSSQIKELDNAIEMCNGRTQQMMKMMGENHMQQMMKMKKHHMPMGKMHSN